MDIEIFNTGVFGSEDYEMIRNEIIKSIYSQFGTLLKAKVAGAYGLRDYRDSIEVFFRQKMCKRSIEELHVIALSHPAHILADFDAFMIEYIASKNRNSGIIPLINKISIPVQKIELLSNPIIKEDISRQIRSINMYFNDNLYGEVFHLIILGYSYKEIENIKGFEDAHAIQCRIISYIRNMWISNNE